MVVVAGAVVAYYFDNCHVPSTYERIAGQPSMYTEAGLEEAIVVETNRVRVELGLGEVEHDAAIRQIARRHTVKMMAQGVLQHELDGRGPTDGAEIFGGYRCGASDAFALSENLLVSWDSNSGYEAKAESFVQSWLDSPGHRLNLLDVEAVKVGVGVVILDGSLLRRRVIKVTQNLGSC